MRQVPIQANVGDLAMKAALEKNPLPAVATYQARVGAPLPPLDPDTLDPGVRFLVARMREAGFCTTESGDGTKVDGQPDALPFPHVYAVVWPADMAAEAQRLAALIASFGVPPGPGDVEASYDPTDGSAVLVVTDASDAWMRAMGEAPRPSPLALPRTTGQDRADIERLAPLFCGHLVAALELRGYAPTPPPAEHIGPEDHLEPRGLGRPGATWRLVFDDKYAYVRLVANGRPWAANLSAYVLRLAERGAYVRDGKRLDIASMAKDMADRAQLEPSLTERQEPTAAL